MKNRFKNELDGFFTIKVPIETFVINREHFDVIAKHWRLRHGAKAEEVKRILGHGNNMWNLYIRFKPSFPKFDKLPNDYDNFDLIYFHGEATYYSKDGENKIFGCDYAHFGDDDVMDCETFDESNRCFIDAHKILEELEQIWKGEKHGKN